MFSWQPPLKSAHHLSRYGASRDWQVPVTTHSPGHRHRDGGRLGGATVFRQLRYVWLRFSDVGPVDGLFFCRSVPLRSTRSLNSSPDPFHSVTGKKGGRETPWALMFVCVCLRLRDAGQRRWLVITSTKAWFVCLCLTEKEAPCEQRPDEVITVPVKAINVKTDRGSKKKTGVIAMKSHFVGTCTHSIHFSQGPLCNYINARHFTRVGV